MSKEVEKKNQEVETEPNGTAATADEPKKGVIMRTIDCIHRKYLSFRATTAGRWIIRGTKAGATGLALYETYKLGQKHAPVTLYMDVKTEEAAAEETPVEEPANEEDNGEQKE